MTGRRIGVGPDRHNYTNDDAFFLGMREHGVIASQFQNWVQKQTDKTAGFNTDSYSSLGRTFRDPQRGLEHMWAEQLTMLHGERNRMIQDFERRRPNIVMSAQNRPIVNSMTRELVHPNTGASTQFFQRALLPSDPSEAAIKLAANYREGLPSDRANVSDPYFRRARNPGTDLPLSFRYVIS